jgi:hypothetical protein
MRTIAFTAKDTTSPTVAWQVDRDCIMTGLVANGNVNAVVSKEPDLTISGLGIPTITGVTVNLWRFGVCGISGLVNKWENLKIPLYPGETIYCSFNAAAGNVWLQLEDPPTPAE